MEKIPQIKKLIKELKKKIFNEKFTLFREGDNKDQSDIKDELE